MKALLAFALQRRPVVLLCLIVFLAGGLVAFSKLNIEAYPNPAPVILEITAQAPGLSAEEMERYYTTPIEVGVSAVPGVEMVRSTSFYGLSFVRVTFRYETEYYFAYQMTALALQQNVNLPNNVQPQIQGSSLVGEIFRYQVKGPAHFGLSNLRAVQDWIVQRRLLTVPGVVQVNSWGGTTRDYEVEADPRKLEAYHISLSQLVSSIGNANVNVGGRNITIGQQSINIRGIGLIDAGGENDLTQGYHLHDIENIVLSQTNGSAVLLKDVAHVQVGSLPRLGKAGRDEEDDVVAAIVVMNRTMHTNEVAPRVKAELEKLNKDGTLPKGVYVEPFYDRLSLVAVTTHTVLHNLVFGCLLVFLIQWVFLGDVRSALIVGANIPFALLFSIIILVLRGEDANLLSIGAVDFGIIVDSAVILVENIFRKFEAAQEKRSERLEALGHGQWGDDPTNPMRQKPGSQWNNRLRLIFISALQVDKAILFSTTITIAAFLPLFTMQGVEGQIFGPMARTYGYALAGALIATFTVTPVLASLLLPEKVRETETRIVRGLREIYTPALKWALARRGLVVMGGVIFLLLSGFAATRLGNEFLPALEEGNLWIRASLPPTISLEAGIPLVAKMRHILLTHPEIVTVISQHGRPDDGSDASGFFNAEFFVPLKPFDEWPRGMTKEKLVAQLQEEFGRAFVGVDLNFSQYIQDNVEEGLSGIKGANSVKIVGPDLGTLEKIGTQVLHEMRQVEGVTDLGIFRVLGQPNLNIKVDRTLAARYGLNSGDVNTVVQAALGGAQATSVLEADRQFPLTVRLGAPWRGTVEDVKNLRISFQTTSGASASVALKEIAQVTLETGASYIYHERSQRFIPIKFSVRGRDLGHTVEDAQKRLQSHVKLPQGYRFVWAGEFDELQEAKARLAIVVPVSLLLILALLYGLFNDLRDSLLVLAGVPFSAAGGVIALFLFGVDFSISAAVGFISLLGVSVMNGILLITYYNEVRQRDVAPLEAMLHAAEQRMRPMLMTAFSACIGLLPAAFSTGIGAQVQRPLALVVVGGMLIGPVMMLLVVPALQLLFLRSEKQ